MGKSQVGGRSSTRKLGAEEGARDIQFDYGAQFFRATTPYMKALVGELLTEGVVAEWRPTVAVYDVAAGAFNPREGLARDELRRLGPGFFDVLQPGAPGPSSNLGSGPAGRPAPLYVATPSMDMLCAHLARAGAQAIKLNTRVHRARLCGQQWVLSGEKVQPGSTGGVDPGLAPGEGNIGVFDAIVLADSMWARPGSPGYISFDNAPEALKGVAEELASLERVPLFSVMMAVDGSGGRRAPPLLPYDATTVVNGACLEWIARDTSKPGRDRSDGVQCWVAVTRADYAIRQLADVASATSSGLPPQGPEYQARKAQEIWAAMQADLRPVLGIRPLGRPRYLSAHRWGLAYTSTPLGQPSVADADGRWAACGEWCQGPGIEQAAISGAAAADAVYDMLQQQRG